MLTIFAPILAMAVLQGQPQQVEASSLPKVNGPMPPNYFDPAPDSYRGGLDAQMRRHARRGGTLPAVALPTDDAVVSDQIKDLAGWKAYQVIVPAGQTVHVRLRAEREAWFEVKTVNRWGNSEKGMVQNLLHKCDPEASYVNMGKETKTAFFVVDTNELNMFNESYTLHVTWK